ncbi:hypothetical protein [Nocardia asteroides]
MKATTPQAHQAAARLHSSIIWPPHPETGHRYARFVPDAAVPGWLRDARLLATEQHVRFEARDSVMVARVATLIGNSVNWAAAAPSLSDTDGPVGLDPALMGGRTWTDVETALAVIDQAGAQASLWADLGVDAEGRLIVAPNLPMRVDGSSSALRELSTVMTLSQDPDLGFWSWPAPRSGCLCGAQWCARPGEAGHGGDPDRHQALVAVSEALSELARAHGDLELTIDSFDDLLHTDPVFAEIADGVRELTRLPQLPCTGLDISTAVEQARRVLDRRVARAVGGGDVRT